MKRFQRDAVFFLFVLLLLFGCGGGGGGGDDGSGGVTPPVDNNNPPPVVKAAAHIHFVSATPTFIALKNTGGPPRSETSVLVFSVVDADGFAVSGKVVDFALSTAIGGLSLSASSATSDTSGLVRTTVNSGTVSTEVKVQATVRGSNPAITVASDTLIISTGLPDQNSISISREIVNPEAWAYNNVEVPIIFQAADHFNNFVPDGTVVYFTTGLGSIDESGVLVNGVCKVTWRSGNPREPNCSLDKAGTATITAFLIGEESFVDTNGNGYFDSADTFDINSDRPPDVFRDDNGNGTREECEPFWDFNANGVYDDTPNGIYNGSLCSDEAERQGLCTKELVYVWAETRLVMSDSFAETLTILPAILELQGNSAGTILITIADANGNPLPAGSTVDIDLSSGTLQSGNPFTIPNTLSPTTYAATIFPSQETEETVTVRATVTTPLGNKSTVSNTVTVLVDGTPPPANKAAHINFVSATPNLIALKNTGATPRSETAVLVFNVTDINGNPVANQPVDFTLSTQIGGLYLSVSEAVSDASGIVRTTVNAGTVPTEVKVRATLRGSDPPITIVSDTLIISTGLPDQNSISLSVETLNPEGWDYNNVEVPVIFQAADHFNNFVPDGTVVYFTTELGAISESGVLVDGVCEVTWRSGNPRHANCPPDKVGLSTITAFLIGEESFFDLNSNGIFDAADTFDVSTDLPPDVFRDDNGNGMRDNCEPFWDYNTNGVYDGTPNGIYNGSLCSDEAAQRGLCTKELVYVRAEAKIVMSGSFAEIFTLSPATLDLRGGKSGTLVMTIADENGNPLPAGSSVQINLTNGSVLGDNPFIIPNTLSQKTYAVTIVPSEDDKKTQGVLSATVTTPFGNKSSSSNTVTVLDDN